MSGAFGSSQWMYASGGFYGTEIDGSLRFNDDDSAYLSRTPASAGNRKTWTWSGWVKRGNLGGSMDLFSAGDGTTANRVALEIASDVLRFTIGDGTYLLDTNALFRDISSWYHILAVADTTQATASDRMSLYVNGTKITSFSYSTYPTQNLDTFVNNTNLHTIGARYRTSVDSYFDGYLANIHFIDGQALDASSFGETKSGIWIPKAYSGSYGTNGFHLEFAGNANDTSGNGNNWTANNISAYDYVPDSPTNNFATFNSIDPHDSVLSEGNLETKVSSGLQKYDRSTFAFSSGKWYFETAYANAADAQFFGVSRQSETNNSGNAYLGNSAYGWAAQIQNSGVFKVNNGSFTSLTSTNYRATGHVYMCAVDMDNSKIWFGVNGTWLSSGNPSSGTNAQFTNVIGEVTVGVGTQNNALVVVNFGQDSSFTGLEIAQGNTDENGYGDFYYSPPSGFLALCTANLPAPAIDPADDATPEDNFNIVLYSGNNSTQSVTGVGFQPDFVWIKSRNINGANHMAVDAVRGVERFVLPNLTDNEYNIANTLTSFDADGFSLGNTTQDFNITGNNYVAWNWLAGNGTSSNTNGSITTTVSANQDAGFSILTYTGNGTSGATLGHGLSSAPEMIISKFRYGGSPGSGWLWPVYHKDVGTGGYLRLNDTNATTSNSETVKAVGASTYTIGSDGHINQSSGNFVAYCFHSVDGYSKVGTYTGSSGFPFIYTGFRPAFVLIKSSSDVVSWRMYDSTRDTYNGMYAKLWANDSRNEESRGAIDFLSNGFRIVDNSNADYYEYNKPSATYIYLAFAEQPFKYANAR